MREVRKPVWPSIVAFLIGLPVLYVASFGPACWVTSHATVGIPVVNVVYLPMMWTYDVSPESGRKAIMWYSRIGAAEGWSWSVGNDWRYVEPMADFPHRKP
jgi:hypothetical protein